MPRNHAKLEAKDTKSCPAIMLSWRQWHKVRALVEKKSGLKTDMGLKNVLSDMRKCRRPLIDPNDSGIV